MELSELNNQLSEIFSTIEFEEDGGIHITGTDWYSDDLKLKFAVKTGINDQNQLWEAQIGGVRDELIKSDWTEELELLDEHPLLWKHNNAQCELYFSKPTSEPYELLNDILETHKRTSKGWYELEEFINSSSYISLIELCKSSNALFAKGPKNLLQEYSKCLEKFGMQTNMFGERNPKRWTGKHWVDEDQLLSILIIGKSYIIAERFDFERV